MQIIMTTQPNDVTCGPTSLHAVYRYYGDSISLEEVINQIKQLETGGTIAVFLGKHALARGYEATLYIYNLDVFDPTWFYPRQFSSQELMDKLQKQKSQKFDPRFKETCQAYCDFLEMGGKIETRDLNVDLLRKYFKEEVPIITGLNCTYLYQCAREITLADGSSADDDINGVPLGHFVVLCGYNEKRRHIVVADPHKENPLSHNNYYHVGSNRLIHSILLGASTHDANLLIIRPKTSIDNSK